MAWKGRKKYLKKEHTILLALLAAGLALRLYRLGSCDFWHDEICSIKMAGVLYKIAYPSLYYTLLHYWIRFLGISEFALRALSCLFSLGALLALYMLGRRMFNERISLYAVAIMAASAFQLWYAQEARSYAMFLCCASVSTLMLMQAVERLRFRDWAVFCLVSIIGICTNQFYFVTLATHLAFILFFHRRRALIPFLLCFYLVALVAFLPHMRQFIREFNHVWYGFWIETPRPVHLLASLGTLLVGYNAAFFISAAAIALSILLFVRVLLRQRFNRNTQACFFFFLSPILLVFLFSRFFFPIYIDRGLIAVTPFYYLIIAAGISSLPGLLRHTACGILCVCLASGAAGYYSGQMPVPYWNGGVYIKRPVKPAVAFLQQEFAAGDILTSTNRAILLPFSFYASAPEGWSGFYRQQYKDAHRGLLVEEVFSVSMRGEKIPLYYFFDIALLDTSSRRNVSVGPGSIQTRDLARLGAGRVWVIAATWERDGRIDDTSLSVKQWMDGNYILETSKTIDGILLLRYARRQ